MMKSATPIFAAAIGAATSPAIASTPKAIQGEWVSECSPARPGSSKGSIIRLTIRGSKIDVSGQVYASTKCENATLRGAMQGTISRVRKVGDRWELDYVVGDPTFTLQRADVVDYYNKTSGCGLDQWKLSTSKSIAGRRCGSLVVPKRGQKLFESFWIEGDQLRTGALPLSSANRSPQARPTTPGPLVFRRVKSAGS